METSTHGTHTRVRKEAGSMSWMAMLEAIRHHDLNSLPEQFFSWPAKQPLGLGIDQDDVPTFVDYDHSIRCRLQKAPKSLLSLLPLDNVGLQCAVRSL